MPELGDEDHWTWRIMNVLEEAIGNYIEFSEKSDTLLGLPDLSRSYFHLVVKNVEIAVRAAYDLLDVYTFEEINTVLVMRKLVA